MIFSEDEISQSLWLVYIFNNLVISKNIFKRVLTIFVILRDTAIKEMRVVCLFDNSNVGKLFLLFLRNNVMWFL